VWWDLTTWELFETRRVPVPREHLKTNWWEDFTHWFKKKPSTFTSKQPRTKRSKKTKRERSLKSQKRRRQHPRDKTNQKNWSHTFGEAEQQNKSDYAQLKHKLLHQSWIVYDMQFAVSLDELVEGIDPSRQWRMIKQLHAMTKLERTPLSMAVRPTQMPFGCVALAKRLREEFESKPSIELK
jgi:hypothetical protein